MAGSVFAFVHQPPLIILCVILAVPGFAGWIAPYLCYRVIRRKKSEKAAPLINQKYDEIYAVCEQANRLLDKAV